MTLKQIITHYLFKTDIKDICIPVGCAARYLILYLKPSGPLSIWVL